MNDLSPPPPLEITFIIAFLSFVAFACHRSEDENPNRISLWTFLGPISGAASLFMSAVCETPLSHWHTMNTPMMIAGFCFYGITGLASVVYGGKSLMRIICRTCGIYTAIPIRSNEKRTR